jgi:hypothetical protein
MATKTTTARRDLTAELAYLTRALKAPTLREAVGRLAERARRETWSYEEFLAHACSVKCPPANPTAVRDASVPPASRHGSRWTRSTLTMPEDSNATPSPI